MKKILIVIHDMEIGGAQKSLTAFLQTLARSPMADEYEVSLLMMKKSGPFLQQLPVSIRVLEQDRLLRWMGSHMSADLVKNYFSMRGVIGEACWLIRKKLGLFSKRLNTAQKLWANWKKLVPNHSEHYDVAIAYIDGPPAYYVMDCVNADKKVLWVHSEYQKQGYNPEFDRKYYDCCDAVVTISDLCKRCIAKEFPELENKIHVLENISAYDEIVARSEAGDCPELDGYDGLKLVTVARLNPQKGIDIALEAAAVLKQKGLDYRWVIVGEGSEREKLEAMLAQHDLKDSFLLIGARENPYVYMRRADIIVQPSRIEGKSIVLDEAKMLCRPIVATQYATVKDSITHGENGYTTAIDPAELAEGICKVWESETLRKKFIEMLKHSPKGNEEEINRYIDIMF